MKQRVPRILYVLIGLTVLGMVVGVYFYVNKNNTSPSFIRRTVAGGKYSFAYPADWKNISQAQSLISTVAYTVNGVQYDLIISPPAQLNPEGRPDVTWSSTQVQLGGRTYLRLVWKVQSVPFYMTALPQTTVTPYYDVAMQLPPTNTAYYESIFDQIVTSLQY